MTLLVVLKGKDGLVLAADSRGTFGDPRGVTAQNDSQQKAHILAQHAGVLAAGAGEIGGMILRQASETIAAQAVDGVMPVTTVLRDTARTSYGQWFPTLPAVQAPPGAVPSAVRPDITFLIAGYDADGDGAFTKPSIFQLPSSLDFPPAVHEYGFATAGVPQYALYLFNRLYEPGRSVAELTALAVYAVTETASQDGKVGGPVRVITVRPTGSTMLDDAEVARVVELNAVRAATLRASFYEEVR